MNKNNIIPASRILWIGLALSVIVPLIIHLAKIITSPHTYLNFFLSIGMTSITLAITLLTYNQQASNKEINNLLQTLQNEEIQIIKESIDDINRAFPNINKVRIYTVTRNDFYSKLSNRITKAKSRVYLTYLAKKPPKSNSYSQYATKDNYLNQLQVTINSNSKVIKRIILFTPANKEWIKNIVDDNVGKNMFSLSILKDDNLIPRVPFQLFDDSHMILIGKVPAHSINKRDIVIESKEVIQTYEIYFDLLWQSQACLQILEQGVKNDQNYALLS